MLRADRLFNVAKSMGVTQEQLDTVVKEYKIPVTNIPVYAKGNFSVTDGKVKINPQKIEIGRAPLPSALLEKVTPSLISATESLITGFPGFSIKNLSFDKGKMNFEGTVPLKQTLLTE
jgi:hypothetical protein